MNKKPYKNTKNPAPNFADLEMGKLPPQAIELEEAVLGALMLEKEALTKVIDILREEAFYKDSHRKIFGAIKRLFQRSEPIDILTVTNELKRSEELESIGGAYYISQLTSKIASSANIEYHARIVLQKYIQRELIMFSSETIENAYDGSLDVFELLDKVEKRLFSIADENIKKDPERAGSLINEVIKQVELARTRKTGITGVPSGFSELDRITSGWQNSDLIILAARPSMGKTALALTLACNAAIKFQEPVALFSLEMSNLQLATRIISSETEIPMEKLRKGTVDARDMDQLVQGVTKFSDAPIFIDDTAGLSVFDLRAKARRLKENHGIKMIMIDYLQLMTSSVEGIRGNREQEISSISRALKSLAKELNVPIIALSQLSRAVEQRGGAKRPQLSDLRESGAIEQDADMVLFVYRQDYYGQAPEGGQDDLPPDSAEIIIAKHRNGPLDSVHLKFQKELAKFTEYEPSLDNYHSATSHDDVETRIVQSRNWDDKKNDIEEDTPF
ncbi:MAG TPA: replicative DNA helicase [Bacteroidia bacterium]|nr:replicative DNA helicase [Bacteroidia bacterium]HWY97632.1 replicative DNA helicase [Bacteroidia bacterium]